jgi:hypothetical protein
MTGNGIFGLFTKPSNFDYDFCHRERDYTHEAEKLWQKS